MDQTVKQVKQVRGCSNANPPITVGGIALCHGLSHGSLNVPIEHHPTIRYMVYNGYYQVMSNIPKMGQLPTPVSWFLNSLRCLTFLHGVFFSVCKLQQSKPEALYYRDIVNGPQPPIRRLINGPETEIHRDIA